MFGSDVGNVQEMILLAQILEEGTIVFSYEGLRIPQRKALASRAVYR